MLKSLLLVLAVVLAGCGESAEEKAAKPKAAAEPKTQSAIFEIADIGDRVVTIYQAVTIFFAVAMGYLLTIGYKPWNRRKKNVALAIVFGWIVISCVTMIIVFWLSSRQNSEGDKKTEPKQQAEANATVTPKPEPPKTEPKVVKSFGFRRLTAEETAMVIEALIIEAAIRKKIKKRSGELTKADYEKVETLDLSLNKLTDVKGLEKLTKLRELRLNGNKLTDVSGLEKLTQLTILNLENNPTLTKAQIAELQKALPKCKIYSNFD